MRWGHLSGLQAEEQGEGRILGFKTLPFYTSDDDVTLRRLLFLPPVGDSGDSLVFHRNDQDVYVFFGSIALSWLWQAIAMFIF